MEQSRAGKILKNTYAGMWLRIVNLISQFVLRTILINTLGNQYTGISGLFTSILSVLSLSELGIGTAISFALYEPLAKKDYRKIARLMNFYRKAYRMVALAVAVFGAAAIPFLSFIVKNVPDIRENIILLYVIYLAQLAASYLLVYKSVLLTASQKGYVISNIDIGINIAKTVLSGILLFCFQAFLVYLAAEVLMTILRNILVSGRTGTEFALLKEYKEERLTRGEREKLFGDVSALVLYSVANVVLSSTDNIVISAMLGTSLITYVGNYRTVITGIDGFIWHFYAALNPGIGSYAAEHSGKEQYQVFKKAEFTAFVFTCVTGSCLAALLGEFVGHIWLNPEYELPAAVTAAMLLDFFMNNMLRPVSAFRNGNGLFIQGRYRPLIMAVLNIVLSMTLAGPLGITGVLAATVISRAVTQFWFDPWLVHSRIFQVSIRQYFIRYGKYLLVMGLCVFCVSAVQQYTGSPGSIGWFLVHGLLGICINGAVITLFFHRTEEFRYLIKKLKNLLKR